MTPERAAARGEETAGGADQVGSRIDLQGSRGVRHTVGTSPLLDVLTVDEEVIRERLIAGETVVVNMRRHTAVIEWAKGEGLFVRIDRRSRWGNPFIIGRDGTRDDVVAAYRGHLAANPDLLERLPELRGRALGCWCAPARCHGDVLVAEAKP